MKYFVHGSEGGPLEIAELEKIGREGWKLDFIVPVLRDNVQVWYYYFSRSETIVERFLRMVGK